MKHHNNFGEGGVLLSLYKERRASDRELAFRDLRERRSEV